LKVNGRAGMTITVDITPEVQAELARQAAAYGRALEAHAASLLEEAAHVSAPGKTGVEPGANLVELFAPVRGLFADGELDFGRNPSTGRHVDLT
jgi:hypothetical protein